MQSRRIRRHEEDVLAEDFEDEFDDVDEDIDEIDEDVDALEDYASDDAIVETVAQGDTKTIEVEVPAGDVKQIQVAAGEEGKIVELAVLPEDPNAPLSTEDVETPFETEDGVTEIVIEDPDEMDLFDEENLEMEYADTDAYEDGVEYADETEEIAFDDVEEEIEDVDEIEEAIELEEGHARRRSQKSKMARAFPIKRHSVRPTQKRRSVLEAWVAEVL
jgi:Skp family chaperone for outer membrane proteins